MRITTRLAAIAVTVFSVLAGCAAEDSAQDFAKPTIRIGYQAFPSGDLVVKHNRWLEEALPDYTIEWTKFDSGAAVNQAFIAKQLDFGNLGSSPMARGLSAPLNIPYSVVFVLVVAGENEALVARGGTGIGSISGLKGRRVATPFASTAHYSLLTALAQNGLSANDVQLIDLQPQAIVAAWESGNIDAAYSWLPTLEKLEKTGTVLITSGDLAAKGKPTMDLVAVSNSFAKGHPRVLDIWRRQQVRALREIKSDPAAAAKAISGEMALSPADAERQLSKGVYLTPEQIASPEWLGSEGRPGDLAANLESASKFLAEQKQIPAAAPLAVFQKAIYTKGLPEVLVG
ncbi:ABC transporter substrate-binding protein [Mycolicibacterium sp.]|jgi:taurine transport system substrate-binding protein|uniref:taurine ABC transporter substrate-binding protein n=1 Tax=Mycolicibacterium sp. TaxID=2320850 RepID=UPI0028AAE7CB|nr:ABC transporter substrate-binding protein [Mycolicibacterium sp.]